MGDKAIEKIRQILNLGPSRFNKAKGSLCTYLLKEIRMRQILLVLLGNDCPEPTAKKNNSNRLLCNLRDTGEGWI